MATSTKDSTEGQKLALIIANGDYHRPENKVSNYRDNVQQLVTSLQSMDFKVETSVNRNKHDLTTDAIEFSKRIRNGDLVVCYVIGNANQVGEKNYLLPVDDANIQNERDIEDVAIDIESLFKRLVKRNPSHVTVLVLDCCRSYSFSRASQPICK